MNEVQTNKAPRLICPVCEGSGKGKLGLACQNCGGLGIGVFYFDRFLYWGPQIGRATIELDHLRAWTNRIIDWSAYLIAGSGLLSLGLWINLRAFSGQAGLKASHLFFWQYRSVWILAFWVGIAALMFIAYRWTEKRRLDHRIKSTVFQKNKQNQTPDNWTALKRFSGKLDVENGFTPDARETVNQAFLLAKRLEQAEVTPLHLFYACLDDKEVTALFARLNVKLSALAEKLEKQIARIPRHKSRTNINNSSKQALIGAYLEACELNEPKVAAKNLLLPCTRNQPVIKEILYDLNVDENKIYNVINWFAVNRQMVENYHEYRRKARFKPGSNMNAAYTAIATPTLDHFGYDLTVQAKWNKLEYCVNRKKEIQAVFDAFESGQNACLLVGPPGVGKSTMVDGIAQLMAQEDVPKELMDMRLVEIDAARLISGSGAGQAEGRLQAVLDETARSGNIVLFIDNVESITGITSGSEGSLDMSEILASSLEKKYFYCILSATQENYTRYLEGGTLDNSVQKIQVREPEKDQAIWIIESKVSFIEGEKQVYFSYNALEKVVDMSRRYIHDSYLPKKAVDILESVAARTLKKKGKQSLVTEDDISEVISELTNIPLTKISNTEGETLLNLENKIHEYMVNQEEAVRMVASSLRRARTELKASDRPIASFLFLGPTGVGKTQLAKTLSRVYFGRPEYMVRLDMSEYQHPDSVNKLIGDTGSGGYLTDRVRKSPFSLVLLDEIEKAHPDILNLFLQLLDEGRLTDGKGRTIDFTNTIIICTSNAGARYIEEAVRSNEETAVIKENLISQHLNEVMRPELINRFDGIVVFEPLSRENMVAITGLMLDDIAKMLDGKGIRFEPEEAAVRSLAEQGYDPKFGARPLRRLLQDKVEDEIARKILSGEIVRRDTVIIREDGSIEVEKASEL